MILSAAILAFGKVNRTFEMMTVRSFSAAPWMKRRYRANCQNKQQQTRNGV